MAFVMTCDIKVETKKAFAPSKCSWTNSVHTYINRASVTLPAKCRHNEEIKPTSSLFTEGQKITISCGYNGENLKRFEGFISRIQNSIPVELHCEGYSYQLKKVVGFSKKYRDSTVKAILQDLIIGTDITLSKKIPNIAIAKVDFVRASAFDVLEWFKEKCLLTVYFDGSELYVGLSQLETTQEVKFRLGWNTADDKDLKLAEDRELANVNIVVEAKKEDGSTVKSGSVTSKTKVLKTALQDKSNQASIAEQKRKELLDKGYEGSIKAFLIPIVQIGETVVLSDVQYPERSGRYFCGEVSGSFDKSGGRQQIEIGYQI